MSLRVEEHQYPNGTTYGVFFVGKEEIGRADKVSDGWILQRKRKVQPTAEKAAKAMLDGKLNELQIAENRTRKLLDDLRVHCGGQLPHN